MEWLLYWLVRAFGLTKRHPWGDTTVLFGGLAVHLLRSKVLKWHRGSRYRKWPETQATVTFTRVFSSQRDWAVFYYYFVGSQRYGGYRTMRARNASQAEQSAKWLKGKSFIIRYNPAKPRQSAVLEADNPALEGN